MRALVELQYVQLEAGRRFWVRPSKNNCRLVLGNVPMHFEEMAIVGTIYPLVRAKMVRLILVIYCGFFKNISHFQIDIFKYNNFKHAVIEFETHREAALARRILVLEIGKFGETCFLRWDK